VVKSRAQAIAIGLGLSKTRKMGAKVPKEVKQLVLEGGGVIWTCHHPASFSVIYSLYYFI